jgi:hypothetical protein
MKDVEGSGCDLFYGCTSDLFEGSEEIHKILLAESMHLLGMKLELWNGW